MGATESELTKKSIPYEFGASRYRELARAQITGDSYGMLKLLVSPDNHKLLGVHIFGTNAHRTRPYRPGGHGLWRHGRVPRRRGVNYPTLSETYKIAVLDVMNKLRAPEKFSR
jgi:NAD(P) transhydrogenase